MSLDVYLYLPRCPHCGSKGQQVFSGNVTHNLTAMAQEAGIYQAIWRPEELKAEKASDILGILRAGLEMMAAQPARFMRHNPPNGWGDYRSFVQFVRDYIKAIEEYPSANLGVWR